MPLPKIYSLSELYKNSADDICPECKILKPHRSRHCYYCNRCVYRYDHHCQWVNNCIGINNNGPFFLFLFCVMTLCVLNDFLAIEVFIHPRDDGYLQGRAGLVPAGVIFLLSTILLYPISGLFIVQVQNFSHNLTSNERLSKNKKAEKNGNCFLVNCFIMCREKSEQKQ